MTLMFSQLRAARELGLSSQWLATQQRPEEEVVDVLQKRADRIITGIISAFAKIDIAPEVKSIALLCYHTDADLWQFRPTMQGLPATFHAAIITKVARILAADGINCRIVYMDQEAYWKWLGDREDNEGLRGIWAAMQQA